MECIVIHIFSIIDHLLLLVFMLKTIFVFPKYFGKGCLRLASMGGLSHHVCVCVAQSGQATISNLYEPRRALCLSADRNPLRNGTNNATHTHKTNRKSVNILLTVCVVIILAL